MNSRPYYEDENVVLYQGDSRDILPTLGRCADLLLTDPPYGMAYTTRSEQGHTRVGNPAVRADGAREGRWLLGSVLRVAVDALRLPAHAYVFCHCHSHADMRAELIGHAYAKTTLVWAKERGGVGDCSGDYARDYELILYSHVGGAKPLHGRRDGALLRFPPPSNKARIHPTEKPVELLAYLIAKSTEVGETVLDPFAGSAATLIAAQRTGRRAIGIELDRDYCDTAARRLEAERSKRRDARPEEVTALACS